VRPGERGWHGWLLILPGLTLYVVFVFVPVMTSGFYSLFRWDGITTPEFVGLSNYERAAADPVFAQSLRNSVAFVIWYSVLPIGLALVVTATVARLRLRGTAAFRTAVFIPFVLSPVIVAAIWRWMYSPVFGPINEVLDAIGLHALSRSWLGEFESALPAVGLTGTWVMVGFVSVLLVAGAQKIDESLYDAAKVDGASAWAQFRHVTVPGIRNEITLSLILTLIAAFQNFDLVYVMTRGGPGHETSVVGLMVYLSAFFKADVGYATALAVLLAGVVVGITWTVFHVREVVRSD
jgi:raffinose/stachyose/melibiose transport system permease protein